MLVVAFAGWFLLGAGTTLILAEVAERVPVSKYAYSVVAIGTALLALSLL